MNAPAEPVCFYCGEPAPDGVCEACDDDAYSWVADARETWECVL